MTNPLDQPCSTLSTPCYLLLPRGHEPDIFFDGDRFMAYLDKTYSHFDVATYSFTKKGLFCGAPLLRIRRLIVGLRPLSRFDVVEAEKVKHVPNNHTKLFLCYSSDEVKDLFLGSQNLTHGTNLNLMYRVREEHIPPLVAYFNAMWAAM